MRFHFRRPSPALLIAFVALFAALGGTAWAAAKITGRDIADRSITWRDIARNTVGAGEIQIHKVRGYNLARATVGGYQVDERTLGTVPSAAAADTAGGLAPHKFVARIPTGTAEQSVVSAAGMTLFASCPAGVVALRAATSVPNSDAAASVVAANNTSLGTRFNDFDPGESLDVDQGANNGSGTVSYATPAGATATLTIGFGSGSAFGGTGCTVYGTALGG